MLILLIPIAEEMGDTAKRLEEFRRRKAAEEAGEKRWAAVWEALTLSSVRQRLAANLVQREEVNDNTVDGEEETAVAEWTALDWTILITKLLVWLCLQVIFVKIEFGSVFLLCSAVFLLARGLGRRRAGEVSAYSVFNPGCEQITGTFTAEQFERQTLGRRK